MNVKLTPSDGKPISIERKAAECSLLIKNMLSDLYDDNDDEASDVEVPLPGVNEKTLRKIIEWCAKHKDETFPEDEHNYFVKQKKLSDWQTNYFRAINNSVLCEIMQASNYLNITPLLDQCCLHICLTIRGKSAKEMKEIFVMERDN